MRKGAFCDITGGLFISLAIMMAVALGITAPAWGAPFAYVTNMSSNNVSVIDTATDTVVATVPVERRPHGVAITPDGTRAYVTHDESFRVTVIDSDPASATFNTVIATVGAGPARGVAITPDGSRAYVTNVFAGTASVIDTDPASPTYHTVIATVPGLRPAPSGVAITPDGTKAYVTHSTYFDIDRVSVIDTDPASPTYNTIVTTVGVGRVPMGVAVTPDGTRAYVANPISDTVSVIDTASDTVAATLFVGGGPIGVAISPDGSVAYVTRHNASSVAVIDTDPASPTFHTVIATVGVWSAPWGVAFTPDGSKGYVANFFSNAASVINAATNTLSGAVPVGELPVSVAITPILCLPVIPVAIDIKPGSFPNSINPRSRGRIPVAILTTNTVDGEPIDFDATTVDSTTVLFGATGTEAAPVHFAFQDVDGDGDTDMILHFNTQATGILCGDTSASLTGETFGGQAIEGSDSVNTVGCK